MSLNKLRALLLAAVMLAALVATLLILGARRPPCSLQAASQVGPFSDLMLTSDNLLAVFRLYGYLRLLGLGEPSDSVAIELQSVRSNKYNASTYRLESECANLQFTTDIWSNDAALKVDSITVSFSSSLQGRFQTCVVQPEIQVSAQKHYRCDHERVYLCQASDEGHPLGYSTVAELHLVALEFEMGARSSLAMLGRFMYPAELCADQ